MLRYTLLAGTAAVLFAAPAFAQTAPAPPAQPAAGTATTAPPPGGGAPDQSSQSPSGPAAAPATATAPEADDDGAIVVTARRLEEARSSIQPSLGATDYAISNATIQALPGGDNQQLSQILLQVPGVVQDGFGQFHVREDHGNIQYRINGIILPEGLAVFGQTLTPRFVKQFDLLTGALPAQYGLRTGGIIDIKTKSGVFEDGGSASLYGGSYGTIVPSLEYGGSSGGTNFYVSGEYRRNNLGIENVEPSRHPLHDRTEQFHGFGYVDHILDESNRVSLIAGYSDAKFQIPNRRGLQPDGTWSVGGVTAFPSERLDERQRERTAFGLASFLHTSGPLTLQASLFARYSSLDYYPDLLGELLFNGIAQRAGKRDFAIGGQLEAAYKIGDRHTLRAGVVVSRDRGTSRTTTQLFPVDANGGQAGQPVSIADDSAQTEWIYSAYLQDEWKIVPTLTLNFGARFDRYTGYRTEQQLSPRANLVWTPGKGTTIHAGYARYFSPPPFANIGTTSVARFVGTSAQAPGLVSTTPFAERQNYFDVGIQQKVGPLTLGLDGYYRISKNLIDEGQFGAPIILTPFNYAKGRIKGIEGNVSYAQGPWLLYANLAYAKAQGRTIVSSQFNFDPGELAYIQNHYIYLDHDQTWTASGGIAYRFEHGALDGTKVGIDMIYGSGLRRTPAGAPPNSGHLPGYVQVNASISHHIKRADLDLRFDVTNLLDKTYLIRDGSGVGVGAPQYGPRRGFYVGITKNF